MNFKNIEIEEADSFLSEDNFAEIRSFVEEFPLKIEKKVDLNLKVKAYPQKIFIQDNHVSTIPFYVLAITPNESFTSWSIDFSKIRLREKMVGYPGRFEFLASINFTSGYFYIRIYTIPTRKINLSTPKFFKSKERCRKLDML